MIPLYFHFNSTTSPTCFNLAKHLSASQFSPIDTPSRADFSDEHLALNEDLCLQLEYKHLLAELVNQYCPAVMPYSVGINDDNYSIVLQMLPQLEHDTWILKPALLNNGQGIRLFRNRQAVLDHYLGHQRYGGEHVLQHYLLHPHLLNQHKYTIRLFVVVTSFAGAYLYQDGYFNIAQQSYSADQLGDYGAHLTNEHLFNDQPSATIQIPTTQCPNFEPIYHQAKNIVHQITKALRTEFPTVMSSSKQPPTLGLFGFDFICDSDLRVWLLEVNHGPCFPVEETHVLQRYLYNQFWQQLIRYFIIPMAQRSPSVKHNSSFCAV